MKEWIDIIFDIFILVYVRGYLIEFDELIILLNVFV